MAIFRQLTLGFGAGAFGALVLALVAYLLTRLNVPAALGVVLPPQEFPAALYRLLVWGGIWGTLLTIPVFNRLWWLKGILIGLLATAALALYFAPLFGQGPIIRLIYVAILNAIWGIAAGAWWTLVSGTRKNGRKFGTFMR